MPWLLFHYILEGMKILRRLSVEALACPSIPPKSRESGDVIPAYIDPSISYCPIVAERERRSRKTHLSKLLVTPLSCPSIEGSTIF